MKSLKRFMLTLHATQLALALTLLTSAATDADKTRTTFTTADADQTWQCPAGVTSVQLEACGGGGASRQDGWGNASHKSSGIPSLLKSVDMLKPFTSEIDTILAGWPKENYSKNKQPERSQGVQAQIGHGSKESDAHLGQHQTELRLNSRCIAKKVN